MNQLVFFVFRLNLSDKCKVTKSWPLNQKATSKCQSQSLQLCVLWPLQSLKHYLQAQDYYGGTTLHLSLGIVQKTYLLEGAGCDSSCLMAWVQTHLSVLSRCEGERSMAGILPACSEYHGLPHHHPPMYPTMFICFMFFLFFHSCCSDEFLMNCHYWVVYFLREVQKCSLKILKTAFVYSFVKSNLYCIASVMLICCYNYCYIL